MTDQVHILIYGTGAIGGFIGGTVAASGQPVTFLDRPAIADLLRRNGLTVTNGPDVARVPQPQVVASPADALAAHPDVIVLAVKSNDTSTVIEELQAAGEAVPPILCLQNGVDNEALLAEAFGAENVIAGTVTSAIAVSALGQVVVERTRGVGLTAGHPLSTALAETLTTAGFVVRLYPDGAALKWSKLLTNLVGNATSAICDLPPGEVFAHPGLYRIEIAALREALGVMRAKRLRVVNLPRTPAALLAFAVRALPPAWYQGYLRRSVARGRGDKMPSFHIDLAAGKRRSEVEYLNGAVVQHGADVGIPTPVNRGLTDILTNIVAGETPWDTYRGQPDRLVLDVMRDT